MENLVTVDICVHVHSCIVFVCIQKLSCRHDMEISVTVRNAGMTFVKGLRQTRASHGQSKINGYRNYVGCSGDSVM